MPEKYPALTYEEYPLTKDGILTIKLDSWTDYKKETLKLEQEAAEKSGEYWLEYQKKKAEIETKTTPSTPATPGEPYTPSSSSSTYNPPSALGFGLLKVSLQKKLTV